MLISISGFAQNPKSFHVIYADWSKWGRTSKKCTGFGLCNFRSCTFCCTQEGVVVSCNDKKKVPNSGIISIDKETNLGFLIIKLDNTVAEQNEAIKTDATLYIDTDLTSETITLAKGEYKFDKTIGKSGGYTIPASLK